MICAIVLAAGRSERMGTPKLLLPLGGQPVIARIVDALSASQVDEILVVVGKESEPMQAMLTGKAVRFVENPDLAGDMLGSIRWGLRALPKPCAAALVTLGDQPGISHALVDALIRRFREDKPNIVVPSCNGHRGHPVLFSSRYFEELLTSHCEHGLRGFLNAHADEVLGVPTGDIAAMEDMDTPADYERQKRRFEKCHADTVSPA